MRKKWSLRQGMGVLLSMLVVFGNYSPQVQAVRSLPSSLSLRAGELQTLSVDWPFTLEVDGGAAEVVATAEEYGLVGALEGHTTLSVSLFGLPVRKISTTVSSERILIPGGQAIGAALTTMGILVVGTSELDNGAESPAKTAGLRAGDLIQKVNGTTIESAEHLTSILTNTNGADVTVDYLRDGKIRSAVIHPIQDTLSGKYRVGLWVRDSTAGVGTLSFVDPQNLHYGALGHAIADVDTGVILPVNTGRILAAEIVGIRKGQRGDPGELQGTFLREKLELGSIALNNSFGIYGVMDEALVNPLYPQGLPVGSRQNVHTGKATILTTLNGQTMDEYEIEITRVSSQNEPGPKSMTLRVTDPRLLEATGGIVQGMSGSPILQDGRIIGAVTHVFVSDPAQGYGLFIEWMLENADSI